jgi:hypothetical protein
LSTSGRSKAKANKLKTSEDTDTIIEHQWNEQFCHILPAAYVQIELLDIDSHFWFAMAHSQIDFPSRSKPQVWLKSAQHTCHPSCTPRS